MSTDALHRIAQADTPSQVEVPATWHGLVIWALGRFGGIVIATLFLAYAWYDSNESHKRQMERMMLIMESKARNEAELSMALSKLSVAIDQMGIEARQAHRNNTP